MTDVWGGEGWWLASDGRWYPPELAPPPPPPPPQLPISQASALAQRPASTTAHSASTSSQPSTETGTMPPNGTMPHNGTPPGTVPQRILMSDVSLGEGWWQGTDGKWYAPEVYPSDTPQGDGWWLAANGKWYAPMFHPSYASRASDVSLGEGWWQGRDGKWYAPEVYPSDTPQGDGWWLAANGKWYAPMFHPSYASRSASDVPLGEGWWQGRDGKWYPPETAPSPPLPPPSGLGCLRIQDSPRLLPPSQRRVIRKCFTSLMTAHPLPNFKTLRSTSLTPVRLLRDTTSAQTAALRQPQEFRSAVSAATHSPSCLLIPSMPRSMQSPKPMVPPQSHGISPAGTRPSQVNSRRPYWSWKYLTAGTVQS